LSKKHYFAGDSIGYYQLAMNFYILKISF